jgi:hypothetical protein
MFALQSGLCGVCGAPLGADHSQIAVDHCHTTGAVRGLLHRKCNALLGMADDSLDKLRGAVAYLKRYAICP